MARPYWSGQIRISLVSFGVKLFAATEAKNEIRFHQIDRKTGERVHHKNVSAGEDGTVEKQDIVKGYEYRKGEYVQIDPKEIENLRIPSRRTLELQQFVKLGELDPAWFEKPYFLVPENDSQAEAFAVVRKALAAGHQAGLGKFAMNGREHLMAIAPPLDDSLAGLMGYELRYAEELRSPAEYFADIKQPAIDEDALELAKELIKRKAAKFDPSKFTDQYEEALRAMIDAKMKDLPIPKEEKPRAQGKVINLMDALRKSVESGEKTTPAHESKARKSAKSGVIEMPARSKRRKSA